MEINGFWFLVLSLASFRLTYIAHSETILDEVRKSLGGNKSETGIWEYPDTFFGNLLSCFWCLSVWISFIVWIIYVIYPPILVPFAISAVAIILYERV